MLRHASAAMTLDVYAGLFADNLDDVADRLDQAFGSLGADQLRTEAPGSRWRRSMTVAERAYDKDSCWSRLG